MILTRDGFYPLSHYCCVQELVAVLVSIIVSGVVRVTQLAIQATTVIPLDVYYLFDLFKQHVKN